MGDLVVSLPFEAGSFDALNELFGLVSLREGGAAWKAVARGESGWRPERGKKGMQLGNKKSGGKKRKTKTSSFRAKNKSARFTPKSSWLFSLTRSKRMFVVRSGLERKQMAKKEGELPVTCENRLGFSHLRLRSFSLLRRVVVAVVAVAKEPSTAFFPF